ncbi:6-phosphofructokinase [Gammaproteobacteria bacterium]|jgi:6-phosphofructokinase 1|nr:6-phosphofructokinase [Gammaproteobacteria bacterium]MDA8604647.1 6-phosphofructokinase [Gammaproteobacteria bacterium]MDA9920552.1 6-phosphofructokinase [Gammaproteobacteria bacterium]MDB2448243.1 6-phosphofructokinase [Gammaproteobacteria bacterium]MDB2570218.1 6-phosphofructokinase [Gammaproteobacteria bacterium]
MKKNALYAQSGGVTAVINATAGALILEARKNKNIGKVFAAENGILGVLREELIDTSKESLSSIESLSYRPGGVFGSCRFKLKDLEISEKEYERLIKVFKAHNIGYFFYNGGNDSADTAFKVSQIGKKLNYPIQCIAIPKTVDNDLVLTDCCPGFGSAAKYIATSTMEASLDVQSMSETSTKVFILEVMGRHAGWMAASSVLARTSNEDAPHIILLPEVTFNQKDFLALVKQVVAKHGYCVVVVSEGVKNSKGKFLAESDRRDAFGHSQLGGIAPFISELINNKLKIKNHWAVADYLQRSARHIASKVDLEQAQAVGSFAIKYALAGMNGVMPIIVRNKGSKYKWSIEAAPLSKIANLEKKLPKSFISKNGMNVTQKAIDYLMPLIQGESHPPYKNGIPLTKEFKLIKAEKKLPKWK